MTLQHPLPRRHRPLALALARKPALLRLALPGVLLAATLATPALADDKGGGPRLVTSPLYQAECGSCHVAYPPGLLPAASWQRVMQNLARHHGSDATLDAATRTELTVWLAAHAGSGKRAAVEPPEDRITRGPWFLREHREVAAATWQLSSVKSPANCGACHTRAEQGDFSERHIRIPK